jgi:broad specificity phosphatase PhoE
VTRTVVHVLRHGEVHNPDKILYGRLPGFRLSDNGRRQAETVAKALADADLVAVLASPLQRAQETATPTATAHGLEIVTEDGLIEAGNRFEGRRVAVGDGALRDPRNWPLLRDPFTPSWGEPYLRIAHRMLGALHRARSLAEGHEALCVSHQLPVWTLRRFVEGKRLWHDPRSRQCALASVTSFVFTGTEITGVAYSEPAGASDPLATGA